MRWILILLFISCSPEESKKRLPYTVDIDLALETDLIMSDEVLLEVNKHRELLHRSPIAVDRGYAGAYAVKHTKYMIEVRGINHDFYYERSEALRDLGAIDVGEVVASGYKTAEEVVSAWMNSSSHRRILLGDYIYCGLGILKNEEGTYFYTLIFYRE